MPLTLDLSALGPLAAEVATARRTLRHRRVAARIAERDHTLWKAEPEAVVDRLGWIDSPRAMSEHVSEIDGVVQALRADGLTRALLLGMGGSSLAPEVFQRVFGVAPGYLDVAVLDSTDPATIAAATEGPDRGRTLYVPATKSGGTVETLSFLSFCFGLATAEEGERAGRRFVAITDPGSGLADLARRLDFRHTFLNDPHIGGRYSALSFFGLVPARVGGVDLRRLLSGARDAVADLADDGAGVLLGATLGAAVGAGRDKLTLLPSPSLAPVGAWIEQLVAESTGKEGTGIVPVDGEPVGAPAVYADDRLFAYLKLDGEDEADGPVESLIAAGQPVVRLTLAEAYDLGSVMFTWEVATAVAGHLMGINPFDQPNVEAAKVLARSMMESYRRAGVLPSLTPALERHGIAVFGRVHGDSLAAVVSDFLHRAPDGVPRPYVALQAYLPYGPVSDRALGSLRIRLRDRLRMATTVGYGPRFLHSTGQLHKGDAGRGLFVQITCDDDADLPIPDDPGDFDSSASFGVLKAAQALGDRQALIDGGRAVLRLHLGTDLEGGLARIEEAFARALDQEA